MNTSSNFIQQELSSLDEYSQRIHSYQIEEVETMYAVVSFSTLENVVHQVTLNATGVHCDHCDHHAEDFHSFLMQVSAEYARRFFSDVGLALVS
ncbi:hypothetical protein P9112_003897 [Eukaryota sp. TZLM1-RC]